MILNTEQLAALAAETKEATPGPLAAGFYQPSEGWATITDEHAAVMRSDGTLLACTGPSEDEVSRADSRLYAASPSLLATALALDAENRRLREALAIYNEAICQASGILFDAGYHEASQQCSRAIGRATALSQAGGEQS